MGKSMISRHLSIVTAAALAVSVFHGAAHAQDAPRAMSYAPTSEVETGAALSPGLAVALSLVGTSVGYGSLLASVSWESKELAVVGLFGVVAGPSLGQVYAGAHGGALVTSGLRAAAVISTTIGFFRIACWGEVCPKSPTGEAMFFGGLATILGTTIYSVVDSGLSARCENRRARRRFTLNPAPVLGPDRSMGMGMALGGTF